MILSKVIKYGKEHYKFLNMTILTKKQNAHHVEYYIGKVCLFKRFLTQRYLKKYFAELQKEILINRETIINSSQRLKEEDIINYINSNLENPEKFELVKEIYNIFRRNELFHFNKIAYQRLSKADIAKTVNDFRVRYPDKSLYLMTDVDCKNVNCDLVDENRLETINNEHSFIILGFNNDEMARNIIDKLKILNLKYMPVVQVVPMAEYYHLDNAAMQVLLKEAENNTRWHFCHLDFQNIFQALKATKNLSGDYVEIGTYKGDSARATLHYMKEANIQRNSYFLDTYEGFSYEEAKKSNDALWQNSHTDTSMEQVREYLKDYPEAILKKANIITDEFPKEIKRIAVCNIDVDMYDAIYAALNKVKDLIVPGGIIISEDCGHSPALIGGQKAVFEFIAENEKSFIPVYLNSGQMFLIKK